MSTNKFTSNNNPTLVAVSNADGETPVYLWADPSTHGLVVDATVTATVDTTGLATDTNQTNGAQKTQIVDAGGEAVTVTGGKLDVNATASLAGETLPVAGASDAVAVAIVDTAGNQVNTFDSLVQYANGEATPGAAVGTMPIFDENGTMTRVSDVTPLPVAMTGVATEATLNSLYVESAKESTLASVDGNLVDIEGKLPQPGTAGSASSDVITIQGISSMTALKVDGSATTQPVSGTVIVNGSKTNNNAAPTTDNLGVLPALVNASSPTFTEGNQSLLSVDTAGNARVTVNKVGGNAIATGNGTTTTGTQRVTLSSDGTGVIATVGAVTAITNALPAGTNAIGKLAANSGVDIGDVDVTTVGTITPGTAATSLGKAEDAGHTTGDVGVFSLGVRNDTLASVTSASADYSQLSTDISGIVMTAGAPRALKGRQVTTITSSTSETTIVTAVASTFLDIYGLVLSNTSASATEVSVRDATAGGTVSSFMVPAGETRGFMLPVDSAIPQATVNNNWTAQCGTSVASLKVTALYVKRV